MEEELARAWLLTSTLFAIRAIAGVPSGPRIGFVRFDSKGIPTIERVETFSLQSRPCAISRFLAIKNGLHLDI